jgi:copper chaperone NosL
MQKTPSIKKTNRILLLIGALILLAVVKFPMWRIDLDAPQYPEGLSLFIYPTHIGGNVDIVNGLNHYIGMKSLHTEDFFEFTILPMIIIGFSALVFLTALTGKRWMLKSVFILFVIFGIVAMIDFWRWEYNYGHNLNPDAPIIVPGMAYQPPLIGFKQLLNFGAYSIPALGGYLFIGVGILLLTINVLEFKFKKRLKAVTMKPAFAMLLISSFLL